MTSVVADIPSSRDATNLSFKAEVIVIITSLGSFRHQFFESYRISNFFDCKTVPYFLIDANRDVSKGASLEDQNLLDQWVQQGILANSPISTKTSRFCIPQVLIDGVSIGSCVDVQDLEEDGDLDWILACEECPACYTERSSADTYCSNCNVQFNRLISDELITNSKVQRLYQGQLCYDTLLGGGHHTYQELLQQATISSENNQLFSDVVRSGSNINEENYEFEPSVKSEVYF